MASARQADGRGISGRSSGTGGEAWGGRDRRLDLVTVAATSGQIPAKGEAIRQGEATGVIRGGRDV